MDELILNNSSQAKVAVSYISFNSILDQYHRNANAVVQSNDLIKLPVLLCALDKMETNTLDKEEAFKLRADRLLTNNQGMFGQDDVNRFVSTEQLLEAIVAFNDNAATNILHDRIGKIHFERFLKDHDMDNSYFLKPLDDRTKNQVAGATNFVSVADLAKLQRRMTSQLWESKKGKKLIEDYLLKHNSQKLAENLLVWKEQTQLVKGLSYLKCEPNGYVFCLTVSDFSDEAIAMNITEKAEKIFFSQFTSLSSN